MGPQALLYRRARPLRDRRAAERGVPESRRADPRQLRIRGRRHGSADPARLHPHDTEVQRSHVACPRLRRHQRAGRPRRRGGTADRRSHHDGHQLARGVRLPGRGRRDDRPAQPPDRRSRYRRTRRVRFDAVGAILSAVGMFFVVFGILQADSDPALMAVFLAVGAAFLVLVLPLHPLSRASGQGTAAVHRLFKNRTSNLGLATQNIQWLLLMGTSFVVSVFLQTVRGYNAIETGVIFTAATVGVLVSSLAAERLAKRRPQRTLIMAGFVVTIAGVGLLLALVGASSRAVAFAPGLLLIGLGLGVMLTPSVNVVQSSFPERSRARSQGCRAASPTSARPSAQRSPARSWSPTSPRGTRPTCSRWSFSASSPSSASPPPSFFPPIPSSGTRRRASHRERKLEAWDRCRLAGHGGAPRHRS